jgi:hypothetical protein
MRELLNRTREKRYALAQQFQRLETRIDEDQRNRERRVERQLRQRRRPTFEKWWRLMIHGVSTERKADRSPASGHDRQQALVKREARRSEAMHRPPA